jgi:hypothetical protein
MRCAQSRVLLPDVAGEHRRADTLYNTKYRRGVYQGRTPQSLKEFLLADDASLYPAHHKSLLRGMRWISVRMMSVTGCPARFSRDIASKYGAACAKKFLYPAHR